MKPGLAIRLVFGCGATVLLLAACGGGGGSTHSVTFASAANRICQHLAQQEATATGFSEAALRRKVALIDAAVSQLEQLHNIPPGQGADYSGMLAAFKAADTYFKENVHKIGVLAYLLSKDPNNSAVHLKLVQMIQPIEHNLRRAAALAFKLGLTQCVKGFGGRPGA